MAYRVYSGPKGSPDFSPVEKSQMLYKELPVLDDALSWARHLDQTGRAPLLIEGDDGVRMDRRAIINALRIGMREEVGADLAATAEISPRDASTQRGHGR